jgi:hypothetical protein
MPRYFTIEEARSLLPLVGRSIREAVQAKQTCQEAEKLLQELSQRILFAGGMHVDSSRPEAWKAQRDISTETLKSAMSRIEDLGVLVKDLDIGLVDFPTLFHGEEVYLCWRMDEADIDYWHGVHEGFAGRKEIDRAFLDNHHGGAALDD